MSAFSSAWHYIIGIAGVIAALLLTWVTGKSKGTTEAKAKADIDAAKDAAQQAQAVTQKQSDAMRVAKDADQTNQSLSDDAARDRMRRSKYYTDD